MENEQPEDGCNVTVYLIPKEPGSTGKRKRNEDRVKKEFSLAAIRSDSTKLSECSKYFETWMSERKQTKMTEFHLEALTDVQHYRYCFDRMHFRAKPIPSVAHCIEILKVALQIEFDEVVNIGLKYLSAVPWSVEEQNQIRKFCNSGQLSTKSTDLCARLQYPWTGVERKRDLFCLAVRVLNQNLRNAIFEESKRNYFAQTFQAIVSSSGPGKCCDLLHEAFTLIEDESLMLLCSITKERRLETAGVVVTQELSNFCWLFDLVRKTTVAQEMVELILAFEDLSRSMQAAFHSVVDTFLVRPSAQNKFASMIYTIFQDLLNGDVLLNSSQRLAFFKHWHWLLQDKYLGCDKRVLVTLVSRFITTFPLAEQEIIYHRWVSGLDGPQQADYNLSEAYKMWIKRLVTDAVKHVPKSSSSDPPDGEGFSCAMDGDGDNTHLVYLLSDDEYSPTKPATGTSPDKSPNC